MKVIYVYCRPLNLLTNLLFNSKVNQNPASASFCYNWIKNGRWYDIWNRRAMKKSAIVNPNKNHAINPATEDSFELITEGLDIESRTICPPSEDQIRQLNQIASEPPFSDIFKVKTRKLRL